MLSDLGLSIQTPVEETVTTPEADKCLREFEAAEATVMNKAKPDTTELTEQDKELRQYRLKYSWRILLEPLTYKIMNANFLKCIDIAKSFKRDPNKDGGF